MRRKAYSIRGSIAVVAFVIAAALYLFSQGPDPGKLAVWEYGDVAEVLHIGPYAEEAATIEKLHAFVTRKGYRIIGDHEEEYLKGPGMFFKGDPDKYYTIIRCRIRKQAEPSHITPPSQRNSRSNFALASL